jgi:hypothetical protein
MSDGHRRVSAGRHSPVVHFRSLDLRLCGGVLDPEQSTNSRHLIARTLTDTYDYTEYYATDGATVTFRECYDIGSGVTRADLVTVRHRGDLALSVTE